MNKVDYNSAFPFAIPQLNQGYGRGISKRELFAGMAMVGILAGGSMAASELVVNRAYVLADQMLAASPAQVEA